MAKLDRIEGFRFWAHKIIPLVYDESLSYYEFLCKVMAKLNETIELLNKQNEELENFEEEMGEKFIELAEEFEDKMGLKFAELKDELVSDINDYFALLIPTFSEDTVYLKGDYVYHNERVYELTVPTTTGEWDSTKWADVTLTESLASRLRAITDKLSDIDEDIAQLSQSLTTAINHLKYDIVPEYNTHSDYYEGDYVYHENVIYKAKQYVTAGEFDSTKWEAVVLATDIATTLRALKTYIDTTVSNTVTQLRSYVDNAVATAETELRTYTDGSVTTAKAELKTYVDEQVAALGRKKVNLYDLFSNVYSFTDRSVNVPANQVETLIATEWVTQQICDLTIIDTMPLGINSISFSRITNVNTGDELSRTPTITELEPFVFYHFTSIPVGTWNFEFRNDGTNVTPFKVVSHHIQHDPTTDPEQLYMYYGGLNSGELGYAIKRAQSVASDAMNNLTTLAQRYNTDVPPLQAAVAEQESFNSDLIPEFKATETVSINTLRRVNTEIDGVLYSGVYRYISTSSGSGTFNPQKWELTTVANEIKGNKNRVIAEADIRAKAINAQQYFNDQLIEPYSDIITYQINALCWVDTEVNGTTHKGIYKCTQPNTTGDFDPQYWQQVWSVGSLIQQNLTALNGKKISDPMTQAQYDALTTVDPNTLYIVVPT